MTQRNLFRSKYLTIDWYYEGIFFGIGKLDDTIGIILPFFIIEFHIPRKPKPKNYL
jgi:hypothetical protein